MSINKEEQPPSLPPKEQPQPERDTRTDNPIKK